jgi:sporadic carbohydrate cluster protein (TIGR04323 family)
MMEVRGYISSRPFFGERVPQSVQNIVIRNYCEKHEITFLLSKSEYCIKECFSVLHNILNDLDEFDGIVLYSLFQLPENIELLRLVFDKVIENKKFMLFVLEDMSLSCQEDKYYLENLFKIKTNLSKCPKNIY